VSFFVEDDFDMQPLSRVRPDNVNIAFGQDEVLRREPQIATKIAECIAKWADTESLLGFLLGILLDADANGALAMYGAVENRAAQLRMITAAAQIKLEPDHFAVFEALLIKIIRPAMRERDKLAHWCWGYLPDVPGLLLLMQPDEKTTIHVRHLNPPSPIIFDKSKIFVVKDEDMDRILGRIIAATDHLVDFTATVQKFNSPQLRDLLLQKLSREPQIREVLDRRKANPETPPQDHEQSSPEESPS
jgi:hypothetical protein